MTAIAIIIGIYIAMFITSPFIALFHELGHAFAYLLLTKPNHVDVFVGSYGEERKYYKLKVGKLIIHFVYSFPIIRGVGLCKSDKVEPDPFKYIIILLAGPFFSFAMALTAGYFVFRYDLNDYLRVFCGILIMFSGISLIMNLFSFKSARADSIILESDGKQLTFTFKYRKNFHKYIAIIDDMQANKIEAALEKLDELILSRKPHDRLVRMQLGCLIHLKKYNEALQSAIQLNKISHLSINDHLNYGFALSMLNRHVEANEHYLDVLKSVPNNIYALNNAGYSFVEIGDYAKAEKILKKAIQLNRSWSHPNNNLGYLKLKQNKLDEAKILLEKAYELDPNEPYNHKHLGIYYLKTNSPEVAKQYFDRCRELDSSIKLDDYITKTVH